MSSKDKLRILTINYEYPPVGGGGGFICRNVMEELAELGHQIAVITSHYNDLPKYEKHNNVDIHRVPVILRTKQDVASLPSLLSYVPSCILETIKILRTQKFDVINTHFAIPSGPAGHFISNKFKIPNVLSIYGGDIYDPTKFLSPHKSFGLKQTVRRMLNSADKIISDSTDIERYARRYYGIEKDITVIPPGVKPYKGNEKTRTELGLPRDKIILSTLGRLVERKNNSELLEIMSKINKNNRYHLVIMGEGPDRVNLERKIQDLNLQGDVTLTGRVGEEKFQYLSASDIYVSTAIHEGFGLVFLEAMESGLPVISYDNGGQVDFLKNSKTGFLVNLGNNEIFCNRLIEMIESEQMRKKMSHYNKNYIKEFYIQNCAKKHLSVLQNAIRQR